MPRLHDLEPVHCRVIDGQKRLILPSEQNVPTPRFGRNSLVAPRAPESSNRYIGVDRLDEWLGLVVAAPYFRRA